MIEEINENVSNSDIQVIPEYLEVTEAIKDGHNLVFVTGGAGTGKSTMIRWLLEQYDGKVLLTAPTGIAAINIDGKTIHSLCQLPPGWILPDDIKRNFRRSELRKAKVLIIDEISMVNPNVLDAVDLFFQENRFNKDPFGGLAVIMIGDLFQLPAIMDNRCKHLFAEEYRGSTKFYAANCMQDGYYLVELNKVFRQKDEVFIDVLANLREGSNLSESLAVLNSRCTITNTSPKGAVWLCPRNAEVDMHNTRELHKIHEPAYRYTGSLYGTFKQKNLPAPFELVLKVGAQVMFTQNDPNKAWVNGTIGTVVRLEEPDNYSSGTIEVLLDNGEEVCVKPARWADCKYEWDEKLKQIVRTETGRYTQFPLMLAWAITIHKSQGQTLEKVHIDLGAGAFEVGQTYVAISRCRSIEGLSLSRPLVEADIIVDRDVVTFYNSMRESLEEDDV